jgi:hypothetical protein
LKYVGSSRGVSFKKNDDIYNHGYKNALIEIRYLYSLYIIYIIFCLLSSEWFEKSPQTEREIQRRINSHSNPGCFALQQSHNNVISEIFANY